MPTNLIGTGPNQIPTNGDLGTMAYRDASAPQQFVGPLSITPPHNGNSSEAFTFFNFQLTIPGDGNDSFTPVLFWKGFPDPESTNATDGQSWWRGSMWFGIDGSQNGVSNGGGFNGWVGCAGKFTWDSGHWNAKPNVHILEYYRPYNRGIGNIQASGTTALFTIYLYPGTYRFNGFCSPGMSYKTGTGFTYYDPSYGTTVTASMLPYASRTTAYDSNQNWYVLN